MKGINEVKKDLRELKIHTHALKKLEMAQNTHLARIKMLQRLEPTKEILSLIEKEKSLIKAIDAEGRIKRAQELEEKYLDLLMALDPLDRSIMIDAFINGVPYFKIGLEIGYSDEGVRKKISKIIKKLAQALEPVGASL